MSQIWPPGKSWVPRRTSACRRVGATLGTAAADATVSLGRRILAKILHRTPQRAPLETAVTDLAADGQDPDAVAALRLRLRKILTQNPQLIAELAEMLPRPGRPAQPVTGRWRSPGTAARRSAPATTPRFSAWDERRPGRRPDSRRSRPQGGGGGRGAGPGQRSVSVAGDNYAPITTGDHSPVRVTTVGPLPPVSDVSPAPGPVGIPGHVPLFVGRTGELAGLERDLADGPGVVVQAVHGLGGIGKSALAARYALLHAGEYTQVVWVSAEDPAGIEAGLGRFAIALEPQLDEILSSDALAERATAWLAAHDRWLLILDNVNSVNDIAPLLARLGGGAGRFLATSGRATGWNRVGAAALRLGVLEPDEALVLLAGILRAAPDDLDGGAELCAELGFLPLAVSQAGAYMDQSGLGPRDYLRLLAEHRPVTVPLAPRDLVNFANVRIVENSIDHPGGRPGNRQSGQRRGPRLTPLGHPTINRPPATGLRPLRIN